MFTGLVEAVGRIEAMRVGPSGGRAVSVSTKWPPGSLKIGESISTSGVCLTATHVSGSTFSADIGPTTLERSTFARASVGQPVNLERAATPMTRLGGHIVTGHVDGIGRVLGVSPRDNAFLVEVGAGPEILGLCVPKGSVALNGVSLTIAERSASSLMVMVIPHTWQTTTLKQLSVGQEVNLEADILARYVAGILEQTWIKGPAAGKDREAGSTTDSPITAEFLALHGFAGR